MECEGILRITNLIGSGADNNLIIYSIVNTVTIAVSIKNLKWNKYNVKNNKRIKWYYHFVWSSVW